MKIGVVLPTFATRGDILQPSQLRQAVGAVADKGFGSSWFLEHLTRPQTYNMSWLEPVVTAGWVAGVTEQMGVGMSVLIAPLRNPVILTWQILTLQHLSQGQLRLGLGAGYAENEFIVADVPMRGRGKRLDAFLDMLDEAQRSGTLTATASGEAISPMQIGPVPATCGPVLIGGGVSPSKGSREALFPKVVLDRILRWGGWLSSPKSWRQLESDWSQIAVASGDREVLHDHLNYVHLSDATEPETVRTEQAAAFSWLYGPDRTFDYAESNCMVGSQEDVGQWILNLAQLGVGVLALQLVAPTFDGWLEQLRRLDALVGRIGLARA